VAKHPSGKHNTLSSNPSRRKKKGRKEGRKRKKERKNLKGI
jgi:hypothetical protein